MPTRDPYEDRFNRTVHAVIESPTLGRAEVVRYERAGKWYIEYDDPAIQRRRLTVKGAAAKVELARRSGEATVHFGLAGGSTFDRRVRALEAMAR